MPTESTFLLAGLFLLLAAAGWAFGHFGERDELADEPPPLNEDYLKGLNFLLNEQTDQAVEHFLNMVRVDDTTIETHFALGSLFRRRGEVDRAIRIHQNIIARPDLAAEQRDQALYSLAKDYLRAGLLDRAEKLFVRLSQGSEYQAQALEQLCKIYELEREWQKAVDAGHQLEAQTGRSLELQITHYFCELADLAVRSNDYALARQHLKKSQIGRARTIRGTLARADIARKIGDAKTSLKLYRRVIDDDSYLVTEALPRMVEVYRDASATHNLDKELRGMLSRRPELKADIAYAAIVADIEDIPIIDECVNEYILSEPTLAHFVDLNKADKDSGDELALPTVRAGLKKLAAATPRYQCKECGFASQQLIWQCPSCKAWETQRPFTRVQFDSVLQRSNSRR